MSFLLTLAICGAAAIWSIALFLIAHYLICSRDEACPHCPQLPQSSGMSYPQKLWAIVRTCDSVHMAVVVISARLLCAIPSICIPRYYFFMFTSWSLLSISAHTDLCAMLLSRYVSFYPIPFFWAASYFNVSPIGFLESVIGAITAYLFLLFIEKSYAFFSGINGMGNGDKELLALIGSMIGMGWWYALLIGSWIGTLYAIFYMLVKRTCNIKQRIPFAPLMIVGTAVYQLCWPAINQWLCKYLCMLG